MGTGRNQTGALDLWLVAGLLVVISVGGFMVWRIRQSDNQESIQSAASRQQTETTVIEGNAGSKNAAQNIHAFEKEVVYFQNLKGMICKPEGVNLPAVMYNHGGNGGEQIGGDPEGACAGLKKEGMVGFSPIRSSSQSASEEELKAALSYLQKQDYVNSDKIGLMGFSKAVSLTYNLAIDNADTIQGMVLMAGGKPGQVNGYYKEAGTLNFPVRLMVAQNDTPAPFNGMQNMVEVMTEVKSRMKSAGADASLTIYPPYQESHGHKMFFEIGDYFKDVIYYFNNSL